MGGRSENRRDCGKEEENEMKKEIQTPRLTTLCTHGLGSSM
jgi:hypothetical protein